MSSVVWFIVRWLLRLLPLILLAAVLHFNLPGHDIVRVVGTEVNRMDRTTKGSQEPDAGCSSPSPDLPWPTRLPWRFPRLNS